MQCVGHALTVLLASLRHPPQADIGLGAFQLVAQLFQNRRHHVLFARLVAARAHAQRHHGVDLLLDRPTPAG